MCPTTRGNTNFAMEPTIFMTNGLTDFIEQVFQLDNQDFVACMEGFAIQGLKGIVFQSGMSAFVLMPHNMCRCRKKSHKTYGAPISCL